ncbi:MAG: hypothetical protein CMB80_00875 [Flammeovirgaceae bacterium]|nr:hypothetical protein [Flammeovirgaceae bacterium]|tara:strand:- start:108 stop:473 length:366 start_codon:yes stop_codon:yes gene_type:complete
MKNISVDLSISIEEMRNHTDLWPWYWLSYGEKYYAFATVSAFPCRESDPYPRPGTELKPHETKDNIWVGENGTEMIIDDWITNIEQQNGDVICRFIALAHWHLLEKDIKKIFQESEESINS